VTQHPLTIEIRPLADSVTLTLAGELDLASVGTLRACLEQLDPSFHEIDLDLAALTFLDSTGLATLVTVKHQLDERGGQLVVRNPPTNVQRVLEVSGVDKVLRVTSDLVA
jgi:anti-sigma B factor antagonist